MLISVGGLTLWWMKRSGTTATSRTSQSAELVASGRTLYAENCAHCHDVDGGIGPELTSSLLTSYGTARALFDYVRMTMPYDDPQGLTEEEKWYVVAFLLDSKELVNGGVKWDSGTAGEVLLRSTLRTPDSIENQKQ